MNIKFIDLANSIKEDLEDRFPAEGLSKSYLYTTLLDIITQYHNGSFTSPRTDIAVAATKLFDSNTEEDNQLVGRFVELAKMYRAQGRLDQIN